MAASKPQSKREEFRRYLEKTGVMDALTRVLVELYEEPERPSNAIEYFLDRLGAGVPLKGETETLHTEVSDLQKKIRELEDEVSRLNNRLESFTGPEKSSRGSRGSHVGGGGGGASLELDEEPTTWSEAAGGGGGEIVMEGQE